VVPIHALLARIRWDPHFGRGRWEIAYLDRARPGLVRVPLDEVRTQAHIGFVFDVIDEQGIAHSIPYHRVRQVWRDGKLVWSRLAPRIPRKVERPRPVRKERAGPVRMHR
jgi:uncharacterized protein (UPF0248 family)